MWQKTLCWVRHGDVREKPSLKSFSRILFSVAVPSAVSRTQRRWHFGVALFDLRKTTVNAITPVDSS